MSTYAEVKTAQSDEDLRPFGVNLATAGRFGGAGLMGGASLATALMFVRMLKDMGEDREARERLLSGEDDNTLVLTLPAKRGASETPEKQPHATAEPDARPEAPAARSTVMTSRKQARKPDGKYGESIKLSESGAEKSARMDVATSDGKRVYLDDYGAEKYKSLATDDEKEAYLQKLIADGETASGAEKSANWQTLAASLMALGAGGGLGYSLVNKLYDIRREKELQSRLEQAKTEYLDALAGTAKEAEAETPSLFRRWSRGQAEKSAQAPSFSTMDYPLGLAALLFLLGTGGTAWMTKKFLDEYGKTPASTFKPQKRPRIERILFRTEGGGGMLPSEAAADIENAVKEGSADDGSRECFEAALGVMMDMVSGEAGVLGANACGRAMKSAGTSAGEMYKMAQTDFDDFMMYLKMNPDLRRTVRNVAMDQHPLLRYFKWAAGIPGIRSLADMKLYDTLSATVGPEAEIMRNAKSAGVIPGLMGTAVAGSMGGTAANLLADLKADSERAAEEPADETPEERDDRIAKMLSEMQVGAADPEAAKFIADNADRLRKILILLAEEGKI